MIPSLTSLSVANRALVEIARGKPLASGTPATNFDGTPSGIYAGTLYQGAVQLLLRQQDWEFSKRDVALTLSGNAAPQPWAYEYIYPADCIKVRQVRPATWVQNDPQPVRWEVGDTTVSGNPATVIWTNQVTAWLVYTSNLVTEGQWDDVFTEQMVRYLGSQLALPTAGRPDFSRELLDIAGKIGMAGEARDS